MSFTKKLLRTSDVTETGEGISYSETWRVFSTEIVPLHEAYDWFRANSPRPGRTMIAYAGLPVLCDSIRGIGVKKARKLFDFVVAWKSPTADQNNQTPLTSPSPFGATESPSSPIDPADPDTWALTVSRRPQLIQRQVAKAYYLGGYNGDAHVYLDKELAEKSPIVNSAMVPMMNIPDGSAVVAQWEFRRLSRLPPGDAEVTAWENVVNNSLITIEHNDLSFTFPARTLWVQCIALNETSVNGEHAWETVVTALENQAGFAWELADVGNVRRAWPGDKDEAGNVISAGNEVQPGWIPIVDDLGRPVNEPIPLDGDGKPLAANAEMVFGKWLDMREVSLTNCPVIKWLIAE